ncbi:MAG: thiol-disulfide oxidoreductase [Legionellaceae bacterium]|nr:thiol-disulfide oxidoreductase [Legionellaceae bacterium]HCA89931.1 TlpA family protein disulfide reductase [Legionellales bacterium]|tara:strand:+ start:80 stop:547 length:468 start_codon:yes stop_codon:yes gene_type:complete
MRFLCFFLSFGLIISSSLATPALTTLQGTKISLTELKGQWVVINYWASWCAPCLAEIKALNQFYQQKPKNVLLFGVNFEDTSAAHQQQLTKQLHIMYPNLRDNPQTLLKLGEIKGVPVTFILNPQGQLQTTLYGPQTLKTLSSAVREFKRDYYAK